MKVEGNSIVALDFGDYSFLPPSFFAFVLDRGDRSGFTFRIAREVVYPLSTTEVTAMVNASCALVPMSTNTIGEQISLLSFSFSLPPFPLQEYRVQCATQVFRRNSMPGSTKRGAHKPSPPCVLDSRRPTQASLQVVDSPEGRCFAHFHRLLPNLPFTDEFTIVMTILYMRFGGR